MQVPTVSVVPEQTLEQTLRRRLDDVETRIQNACLRTGRSRGEVTLVAVTKSVSAEIAGCLHNLGIVDLGENRPQEMWNKVAGLPGSVRWHMIGHLQRNKIERTLPLVHMIHAVDSVRLLEALDQEAIKQDRSLPVLLEVNASREAQKQGFSLAEVPGLAPGIGLLKKLHVVGLMTMAALEPDPASCRPTFAALRGLRDQLAKELSPPHLVTHLSMGMSNDFEVAIEEGATMVRLGSVLFEGLA
jgi:pyridoxal phosphate enzyme (YggS family)